MKFKVLQDFKARVKYDIIQFVKDAEVEIVDESLIQAAKGLIEEIKDVKKEVKKEAATKEDASKDVVKGK